MPASTDRSTMIGLELGISVASAALREEPTGAPITFNSDVVATAKRPLKAGEMLDGEGGFCVWAASRPRLRPRSTKDTCRSVLPTTSSSRRISPRASRLKWSDVAYDPANTAVKVRREEWRPPSPAPTQRRRDYDDAGARRNRADIESRSSKTGRS